MKTMPVLRTREEIAQRFDLKIYDPIYHADHQRIIFFDGDTSITGDLNSDWAKAILEGLKEDTSLNSVLIIINGNLTVEGDILINDYHPHLLVLGNVHCDMLQSGDELIHISGDAHIKHVFYGYYNDGSITIAGTTYVPYVVNSDHDSNITPQGAILINRYSDHNDFFEYDYTREVLPQVCIPAVFDNDKEFDVWKFIDIVRSGQSPFNKGAKPTGLKYEDELAGIVAGNKEELLELDWSGKKLKVFPDSITQLKHLKKLDLSNNNIREIPAAIGELENLEELYMKDCGVETISEAIGNCNKLRIWDLSTNHDLKAFPDAIGELSNLQVLTIDYVAALLPESMARLEKLEAINMYSCYQDVENRASFPEVLTRLKNLKRLDFRENKITEMPDSILNIQSLEEFQWTGGSTSSSNFPDFTSFKHLKKLVISRKFHGWKKEIFNITSLEHLAIDRNEEEKGYLEQEDLDYLAKQAEKDEASRKHLKWLQENTQLEADGRFSYIITHGMKEEELHDIDKLPNLKFLDLSFNNLTWLPDTIFECKNLEFLDLRYNRLPVSERLKIANKLPKCTIDFRDNKPGDEVADTQAAEHWQAMNKLMFKANRLRNAKDDRTDLLESLEVYDQVLTFFSSGKVVDEYNLLYANYGKVWAYSYLTSYHKATFSPAELLEISQTAIKQGLHTLSLIPAMIWHFTDLGKFHEEITRVTTNAVAWLMHVISDKKEDVEKALEIIGKGAAFVQVKDHYFVYDTQVRILLMLGRTAEAYQIVKRTLALVPDFGDFQDLKKDANYNTWLQKQG
jgi:Leucine-rich repeat (LRR) protein